MLRAELALYIGVVGITLTVLLINGVRYSAQFAHGAVWHGYAPGLRSSNWWPGQMVDLSDDQWRTFRGSLTPLSAALTSYTAIRGCLERHAHLRSWASLLMGVSFLGYLHGVAALYVLILAALSFAAAHACVGTRHGAIVLCTLHLGALLLIRVTDGFRGLDSGAHRGAVRWEICYNLGMLRMLSYALDLHGRASSGRGGCADETTEQSPATPRQRVNTPLPDDSDYSLLPYLQYIVYPPLYLAGPIITYQDFQWQQRMGRRCVSWSQVARYALRFGADIACLELLTHTLYFNSLAKNRIGVRYKQYGLAHTASTVAITGWWVLSFMWLKFATIWRFFRLAALMDGTDAPENMPRCFANNFDVEGFWKGWHASFNLWLVRYIYIPLGGSRRRALIIWPVFLFVAVWHDLEFRLLAWSCLICLAFLPEILLKRWARGPQAAGLKATPTWRHICAAGGALNIAGLMAVNLTGFVLGTDGLKAFLSEVAGSPPAITVALGTFFAAAQLMFALRGWQWEGDGFGSRS